MLRRSFLQLCLSTMATLQLFRCRSAVSPKVDAMFSDLYGKSFAELLAAYRQDAKCVHELTVMRNVCQELVAGRTIALIDDSDAELSGNVYAANVAQVAFDLRKHCRGPERFVVISLAEGCVYRHYGPWPTVPSPPYREVSNETPSECIRTIGHMAIWHPKAFPVLSPLRFRTDVFTLG